MNGYDSSISCYQPIHLNLTMFYGFFIRDFLSRQTDGNRKLFPAKYPSLGRRRLLDNIPNVEKLLGCGWLSVKKLRAKNSNFGSSTFFPPKNIAIIRTLGRRRLLDHFFPPKNSHKQCCRGILVHFSCQEVQKFQPINLKSISFL